MILFATQNFLPSVGGTQLYVTGLADALAKAGREIAVYCDAANQNAAKRVDEARNYPINRFGGLRPIMRRNKARAVAKRIAEGGVSALIADTWKSLEHLPADILGQVRVLCLAHGSEFLVTPGSPKERRMVECLAKANVVGANSHFTANLVRPFCRDAATIRVLLPGVEPPFGASSTLTKHDDWHQLKLLTIARLEERKGIDKVLTALPLLASTYTNIAYDVVGKGEDRERLAALAAEFGVAQRVRFHGFISEQEKAKLLAGATLFVLPNRREHASVEGFGIVFIEAAAFGVPSIAGADGGTSDAVLHERTGLLVDGGNDTEITAAILRLLADPKQRQQMGDAAHQRFWHDFAWDEAVHRFEDALRN